MSGLRTSRRGFLRSSAAGLAVFGPVPYVFTADAERRARPRSANDRLRIGAVGMRYQGSVIAEKALAHGDVVAICDVDRQIAEEARQRFGGKAELYEDYRKMLDRAELDVVTLGTPDHWHAAITAAACLAGKDVYCEKPLTLTVDEGKLLVEVVRRTGRVVQVGSWQRSDHRFRLACEMVRAGRIGRLRRVLVVLKENPRGGPFQAQQPPAHLNWDLWLGQTPKVPYVPERCHYTFRWWYEYAGGEMTDWGAHHMDVAQWGIGVDDSGPVRIESKAVFPDVPNGYSVATSFSAKLEYANGVTLEVRDAGRNGVTFEGDQGQIFVNRGTIAGKPIDAMKDRPFPREEFKLYPHDNLARPPRVGKLDAIVNHVGNFFDCVRDRKRPISDVLTQHRSASVCHLANVSMRLGRSLTWDPARERCVGDEEANRWLSRPQREPYKMAL